jgi:glucose-1-phosphate adenylyltransferase
MGIYVFTTRFLLDQLRRDAADHGSSRDFGKDIIPYLVDHGKAVAHRFMRSCVRSSSEAEAYWRDVGTLDAYWAANIDLTQATPGLDLYDTAWPIWTYSEITPPAKLILDEAGRGGAVNAILSGGCIVSGATVQRSLLFTGTRVDPGAHLEDAVVLPGVEIARSARLTKVIVDRGVRIPEGLVVGEDPELDQQRFRRTESGICLITQPMISRLEG